MRLRSICRSLFLLLILAGARNTVSARDFDARSLQKVTAAQLRDYLFFVASDEMEGRDTPSRGLNTTAKFIATLLSRWGVKPGGDAGSYFQTIKMVMDKVDPTACQVEVSGNLFKHGSDYHVPFALGARTGKASGQLFYAGDGYVITGKKIDPYKDVNVRGKTIVANYYGFDRPRRQELQGTRGKEWSDPLTYAKAHGALGVIFIAPKSSWSGFARAGRGIEGDGWEVEKWHESPAAGIPAIIAGEGLTKALFAGEARSADQIVGSFPSGDSALESFALSSSKTIDLQVTIKDFHTNSQNVIGIIEGSDPKLKEEYVGVSAHYDHVGTSGPVVLGDTGRDVIFNGADDDGSGTVAVLSLADALSHTNARPKRSVLFIWHMGEEKGLWGSQYFVEKPTVPLAQIAGMINIDMIGRSRPAGDTKPANKMLTGPNEIYVVGATLMSTAIERLFKSVNDGYLKLTYNYHYDDPKEPERIFYRSDHYNYAMKKIPVVFYFDGVHEDYHQASDHADKIDYNKMEMVTRTVLKTLWTMGDLAERPKVDKTLPKELTGGL